MVAEWGAPSDGGVGVSAGAAVNDVAHESVLEGDRATEVWRGGTGPVLLYLHSEEGAGWNPLLDELAGSFTVVAPVIAGTEEALATIGGLHDLLVHLLDVMDALDLDDVPVVGESFGAMVAAELAAIARERVNALVLLAPIGLWDDARPVPDLYAAAPKVLTARLFGDPESAPAQAWASGLQDKAQWVERMRSMRAALHFVFPIPDVGLSRRLHRVATPTLLLWGTADGVVAPSYADDFAAAIDGARVELLHGAGHLLSSDAPAPAAQAITAFLT
jgi:pimeloyl-ACP methyl ester carboxylesterase